MGPRDSTIVAHKADKLAELIVLARHVRLINRPLDYRPLKDKNLCLSLLGLVHKSGKLNFLVLRFKKSVYTPTLYCGWERSFNSQPGKHEYQRKQSVPNSKH